MNRSVKLSLTKNELSLAKDFLMYFEDDIVEQDIMTYNKSQKNAYKSLKEKFFKAQNELRDIQFIYNQIERRKNTND
jgi:hypothetical protein